MSSGRIGIFVATMTGLAEICAEEVAGALKSAGWPSQILLMDGLDMTAFDEMDKIVIVSSTYGHGDIPDNGQVFYEALEAHGSLADKAFAVFALGDRTYADTFCHAGEKWDTLLASKGARRLVPLERHDASSGTLAEDEAGAWASRWVAQLKLAA
jgi:MioC protein